MGVPRDLGRDGRLAAAGTAGSIRCGRTDAGGTSPVLAGGLLYVQWSGDIHVYAPATGKLVGDLPIGDAHWQSPIVVDGRVAAGEGNATTTRRAAYSTFTRLG